LLTRTFFALRRPWIPTRLAVLNVVILVLTSLVLYKPLGITGIVLGTAFANAVMAARQLHRMRIGFNGRLEGAQTTMITVRILLASVLMAVLARGIWALVDSVVGRSLLGQLLSVGIAIGASSLFYARATLLMRIPEARQIEELVVGRLRARRA
jgi:putative peptidoglycan lipid II flippase